MTIIDRSVETVVRSRPAVNLGRIAVIGLGYVGLPTALAFVAAGADVDGIDINSARVDAIRAVDVDILERDRLRLRAALDAYRFRVGADIQILRSADSFFICVPTPVDDHHAPDL